MSKEEIKELKKQSPVGRIFDFSERWSPMLVKELRQGLRSISFAGIFITLQTILCFIIFLMLVMSDASSSGSGDSVSGAIFVIYALAVCALQPLRGFNAISAEINNDTIDLVLITRLSAWKFVFGKWVSIMSQSLIFAISLLPYLILRYFLGGMILFEELILFALIFISGSVATAIAVGVSAIRTAVLRYLTSTALIGTLLYFTLAAVMLTLLSGNGIIFQSDERLAGFCYVALASVIIGSYTCWMFLDFGASMIAPISENRATLRRIIYLIILAIGGITLFCLPDTGYSLMNPANPMIQIAMLMMLVPFFITTYCEHAYLSPRIAINMQKRRFIGKFKVLLYPGWGTGSLFLAIVSVIHLLFVFSFGASSGTSMFDFEEEFVLGISICLSSLAFPACIVSLFARNSPNRLGIYLISLIGSFLLLMIVAFISGVVDEDLALIFIWCPPVNFYIWGENAIRDEEIILALNIVFLIGYWLIILARSAPTWSHIRQQEKAAKEEQKRLEAIENDGIPTTETTPAE